MRSLTVVVLIGAMSMITRSSHARTSPVVAVGAASGSTTTLSVVSGGQKLSTPVIKVDNPALVNGAAFGGAAGAGGQASTSQSSFTHTIVVVRPTTATGSAFRSLDRSGTIVDALLKVGAGDASAYTLTFHHCVFHYTSPAPHMNEKGAAQVELVCQSVERK
jgi:hypothetical protein